MTNFSSLVKDLFHYYRNVPYDVDDDELSSVFRQFGTVRYCRPVLDPVTNRCKGSAFVQYRTIESVTACIEAAKSEEVRRERERRFLHFIFFLKGLWVGQDKLMIDVAVSKEELSHMKKAAKQQELVEKDSRNLYLLEEGCKY